MLRRMNSKILNGRANIVSIAVFVFALAVVIPNLVSLIFPSLILDTVLETEIKSASFELGTWAIPVLITNVSLLVLGILFYTKKIPDKIRRLLQFVIKFEISKNVALFAVIIIIFLYAGATLPELFENEGLKWGDFERVKPTVDDWPALTHENLKDLWLLHVKNFLIKSSVFIFNNYRIVPFLETVSLLVLTYFFTFEITKKRLSGIIAMGVLTQSNIFLIFDSLATYSNDWTLFYLLSIYLIIKKWSLSPVSYVASIFCKPLTAAFFPMTLFFIFRSEIERRKKFYLLLSYVGLAVAMGAALFFLNAEIGANLVTPRLNFNFENFWSGFTVWNLQMRYESWFLLFILPLTVGLFLTARNGNPYADAVLFLIVGIALSMPLMTAITTYNLHPYRLTPLIVFFAIGIGTLFSQRSYSSIGVKVE